MIRYGVITWIDEAQCCYDDLLWWACPPGEGVADTLYYAGLEDVKAARARGWHCIKRCRVPFLRLGEILLLDEHDVESGGLRRQPCKWGVDEGGVRPDEEKTWGMEYAVYDTVEEAIARSQAVVQAAEDRLLAEAEAGG